MNACIYSCQQTPENRENELNLIVNGLSPLDCPIIRSGASILNTDREYSVFIQNSSEILKILREDQPVNEQYIDPGLWLSTLIFLSVAALFALCSALFGISNILFNPVEPIFGYKKRKIFIKTVTKFVV